MQYLQPNTTLQGGKYRIERVLASGGFGNTYMVQNVIFNETYAMKEFFMRGVNLREGDTVTVSVPDNKATFESQKAKLKKEAQRLRKLHNAHIVQVHDLFEERGTVYYVMDYIDGESLGSRLQRTGKPLTEAEAMDVLRQMLDALDLVHSQHPQLLHLDIKPANIMMDGSGCAYLIDFGASKQIATDDNNALSTTTGMSYTAGYAPSEQIEQNYERMGPWTDFYALGATLYKLVTMQQPPSPSDISDDGTDAFHFPTSISEDFRKLIYWLMTPGRKKRPQSVEEILAFVKEHFQERPAETPKHEESPVQEDVTIKEEQVMVKEEKTSFEEGSAKEDDGTEFVERHSVNPKADVKDEADNKNTSAVTAKPIPSSFNWKWMIGAVAVAVYCLIAFIVNRNSDKGISSENPMQEDIVEKQKSPGFLSDYGELSIGDYFYEDGTYSHNLISSKKCVGMIFSSETTGDDKKHGWTHGYIVAMEDVENGKLFPWGYKRNAERRNANEEGYSPSESYKTIINDYKGYENTQAYVNANIPAAKAAVAYSVGLPSNTSGWYLPSAGQWRDIIQNLCGIKLTYNKDGDWWQFRNADVAPILKEKLNMDYQNQAMIPKYDSGAATVIPWGPSASGYWTSSVGREMYPNVSVNEESAQYNGMAAVYGTNSKYATIHDSSVLNHRMKVRAVASF